MFLSLFRDIDIGSDDRSIGGDWWFTGIGKRSTAGVRVSPHTALQLPAVYAAVRVLSESFAVLPFVLYRPMAGGGRQRVVDHWLTRLFCKRPNAFQTPFEFREMLQGHLALRGNAFCQITANQSGEITDLMPLHPDRMVIEMLENGSWRYHYNDYFGRDVYYARDELWHLRGLSSDGIVGMSPVQVAREAIGEGLAMQSYSSRFFANDAKPGGGWIEYPGKFASKDAKKNFRNSWQELQGGVNRGKVAVLESGMKFHELGLNNADSQFVEARQGKDEEIARIFRIPPHKLQILARSTNNNIEQQAIEFWQDCMLPWTERWESSVECFLLGPDSDLEPEFDMRRMMRGDATARSKYLAALVNAGVLTRNEGREMEGYDPIEGLDEPLRPLNMVEESAAADELNETDNPKGDAAQPGAQDARLVALASAASDRVARKETQMVLATAGDREKILVAYEKHAPFVASALGVSEDDALAYCAGQIALIDERPKMETEHFSDIARCRLERLAMGAKPESVDRGSNAIHRLAHAIAAQPAPVVNLTAGAVHVAGAVIHNEVPAAQVSVEAPVIHVEPPAVNVNVAAPAVTITTPEPVVTVNVEAPTVNVATPQPQVTVIPAETKTQDKPWPTRTTILKRDADGRADVIETKPIE